MLAAARQRLGSQAPELIEADVFQYLPRATQPVWMTTQALNQYLNRSDLLRLLHIFRLNPNSKAFYLFDCVDPLRYRLMAHGSSYRPEQLLPVSFVRKAKQLLQRALFSCGMLLGGYSSEASYLGSASMGYGYLPRFWLAFVADTGLSVEILSSRYYEYRYHVVIRKPGG
jgi:hypothetical protein